MVGMAQGQKGDRLNCNMNKGWLAGLSWLLNAVHIFKLILNVGWSVQIMWPLKSLEMFSPKKGSSSWVSFKGV